MINNQETDSHHSGGETDQKEDMLSSTDVPLLSDVELGEPVYVPNRSSLNVNQVGGFTMPRAGNTPSEVTSGRQQVVLHSSNETDEQETLKLGDSQSPLMMPQGHYVPIFNNGVQAGVSKKGMFNPKGDDESDFEQDGVNFRVFGESGSEVSDIQATHDSTDHRIVENQSRMARRMKAEEEEPKVNILQPRSKKSESFGGIAGTLKVYGGEGTHHPPKQSLPPDPLKWENEQVPGGTEHHNKETPNPPKGKILSKGGLGKVVEGRPPQIRHRKDFQTRAQDLWKESTELFENRQTRWLEEERPKERSRLKTISQAKQEVISDLVAGTMMSMIMMSRGSEGLQSLTDKDIHMITEDEFLRRKQIRDLIKETHTRISRTQEKEQREDLGECLNETLAAMDVLFMDENLWRTTLGDPDQAEDFVEETIGLSSFMNYTNEHGAEPGTQDPMYHRQMRIPDPLIRWYAIMDLGLREILSLKGLLDRAADKLSKHMDQHPLIMRSKEDRVRAQLGVHYMKTIGQDLVMNSDMPYEFLKPLQGHAKELDEYGYALNDAQLEEWDEDISNESLLDKVLLEREQTKADLEQGGRRARNLTDNKSPARSMPLSKSRLQRSGDQQTLNHWVQHLKGDPPEGSDRDGGSHVSSLGYSEHQEIRKEVEEAQEGDADSDCVFIPGPEEMKERLRRVVQVELRKIGKNSEALLNAIIDPEGELFKYREITKRGNVSNLTMKFPTLDLSWKCKDKFSHRMHFYKLQRLLDTLHLSCRMRIEFMKYGAGFHPSIEQVELLDWKAQYMDRIETIHQRVVIDYSKPENEFEYWATVWVKIKTDMLGYFWKEPNEKMIEVAMYELFEGQKFTEGETLNQCATKVLKWYNDTITLLKNHGSEKLHDMAQVMSLFRDSLLDKGNNGIQLERIIYRKMQEIVENPRRNLPPYHNLTAEEVDDLQGKSTSRLPAKVYLVVLNYVDTQGHADKLDFIVQSVSDLRSSITRKKKKGTVMVNAAATYSPSPRQQGNQGTPPEDKPPSCTTCGMFCRPPPEGCTMVSNGKFIARNLVGLPNAIHKPQGGGPWSLHNHLVERLRKWGFPKLKINSQQERGKKLDELEQIIRAMYNKQKGDGEMVNSAVATSTQRGEEEPKS